MTVYLIGLPGVGKTYFGEKLAESTGLTHYDLDSEIERATEMSIGEIFNSSGEDNFRQIETSTLEKLSHISDVIISTGGGTPCFNDNMSLMKRTGITVYLTDTIDQIARRIENSPTDRPHFRGMFYPEIEKTLMDLWIKRRAYYEQTHVITGLDAIQSPHLFTNRLELFT